MVKIDSRVYKKRVYGILGVCVVLMIILLVYAVQTMKMDYFEAIGRRAMSFSMVMTDHLSLSDEDVEHLESITFSELLKDPINREFEMYVRQYMKSSEVKYVYLLHELQEDKVKFTVEDKDESHYGVDAGTKLGAVYLIDAVIDEATRLEDQDGGRYAEKDRFTVLPKEIRDIYKNQKFDFHFYSDEWGTYISGFSPLFTLEGNYIGLLASDIYVDEYVTLLQRRVTVLLLFCLLIMVMIAIIMTGFKRIYKIEEILDDLKSRAYLDDMTNFYNRRTLNEQAEEYTDLAKKDSNTIAIIMIDIDYFKRINDTYGHPKGDEIICAVADVIRAHLKADDYPFRYGGDEFMIISADSTKETVLSFAQSILEQTNKLKFNGVDRIITLSIGIAFVESNDKFDIFNVIGYADELLYAAKRAGRNCIKDNLEK